MRPRLRRGRRAGSAAGAAVAAQEGGEECIDEEVEEPAHEGAAARAGDGGGAAARAGCRVAAAAAARGAAAGEQGPQKGKLVVRLRIGGHEWRKECFWRDSTENGPAFQAYNRGICAAPHVCGAAREFRDALPVLSLRERRWLC